MEKWFLMWFIFSGPNPYDPNTVIDDMIDNPFESHTMCVFELLEQDMRLKLLEDKDPTMSHMIFCQDLSWEVPRRNPTE